MREPLIQARCSSIAPGIRETGMSASSLCELPRPVQPIRVRAGRPEGRDVFMDVLPRENGVSSHDTEAPTQPGTPVDLQPAVRVYPSETQPLYPSVTEQFAGPMSPPEMSGPTW